MFIDISDLNTRSQFCELIIKSTIWYSAITGEIDNEARHSFEIVATGKRLDCLTQVFPKNDFKFAFMTTSCPIDLNRLIDSIPKEFGRFYLFKRSPIPNLNEEFPVYQCYFSDCWFQSIESLQPILKQIEQTSGCKIDRRIYTNCLQFPGCFNTNSSNIFFKLVSIENLDFPPPMPEDIILYPFQNKESETSPARKKSKTWHQYDENAPDSLRFVDAWVYHLITCSSDNEIYHWPGCLISKKELEILFNKHRPQINFEFDKVEKRLIDQWEFVCTKIVNQTDIYYFIPTRSNLFNLINFDTKRNLNTYQNYINSRNLGIDFSCEDDQVSCLFHNFEQHLQTLLNKYDAFVGCVAWINDAAILSMMKGKSLGLIVTKDPKNWCDDNQKQLLKQISSGHYAVTSGVHPGTRFDFTKDENEQAGEVRCIGDRSINEDVILMHNKFLVFGEREKSDVGFTFHPKCVWTGSRNFTFAAKRHKENAIIITNEKIAKAYHSEWANLYLNSERLETEHIRYMPTDYFVV
jgi:hypothetical protein